MNFLKATLENAAAVAFGMLYAAGYVAVMAGALLGWLACIFTITAYGWLWGAVAFIIWVLLLGAAMAWAKDDYS